MLFKVLVNNGIPQFVTFIAWEFEKALTSDVIEFRKKVTASFNSVKILMKCYQFGLSIFIVLVLRFGAFLLVVIFPCHIILCNTKNNASFNL